MELHERLKILRQKAGLLQKDMALVLGMAPNAYQRYELGTREPDLTKLGLLANYYDVPVDYLLGRGLFEKWEEIMANKSRIFQALEIENAEFSKLHLERWNEKSLIKFLPLLMDKVDVDDDGLRIISSASSDDLKALIFAIPDEP